MSSQNKNLSTYNPEDIPLSKGKRIGISLAMWNEEITGKLYQGATETLIKHGVAKEDIITYRVPGSFELPLGAQWLIENEGVDAAICIGCVIQGETRHFDFICQAVSQGIMDLNIKFSKPVIFGVLTTDNQQQALDRAGGKHGNKGTEASVTALQMLAL